MSWPREQTRSPVTLDCDFGVMQPFPYSVPFWPPSTKRCLETFAGAYQSLKAVLPIMQVREAFHASMVLGSPWLYLHL